MAPKFGDGQPRPIHRDWLPEAMASAGDPEWDGRLDRIVVAAEPGLRRLRARGSEAEVGWLDLLASWLSPAAALVPAVAVLIFILGSPDAVESEGGVPLSLVAAQGDLSALWEGIGIDADPVLALIAWQHQAQ